MSEKWIKARLERFASIHNGKDYKSNPPGDEVPIYGTGGIMGFTSVPLNCGPAVLTGRKGTIDRPAYVEGDFWNVDTVFCVKADGNVDTRFLYYSFANRNLSFLNEATGVPSVTSGSLYKLLFVVPQDISVQRHIAEVLATCDEVIEKSERAAEKYRQIKAGMLTDLLTRGLDGRGRLRPPPFAAPELYKDSELGPIPKEWAVKRLGDCALISRGGSPRPIEDYVFENAEGYNWIKIGDVEPGAKYIVRTAEKMIPAGLVKTREVHVGDFLLSNSMSFGRPYILKIDGCIHDGWLAIQNYKETFDKEYLYYVLGAPMVLRQYGQLAAGSTVLNLKKEMVAKVLVAAPVSLAEQRAIAERLAAVDERIAAEVKAAEKYRKVKSGLMEKLLTPPADAEIEDLTQEVAG